MATWSTIEADADFMREGNGSFLPTSRYSDSELITLMQTKAKRKIKTDLIRALKLVEDDSDDMTTLDEIVDKYEQEIKMAIAYYQLYLIYYNDESGDGTITNERKFDNLASYNSMKGLFTSFKLDTHVSSKSVSIKLM